MEAIITALRRVGISNPILERPKDLSHGDFAFPCFRAAQTNPTSFAQELATKLLIPDMTITAIGPYVNFSLNPKRLARIIPAAWNITAFTQATSTEHTMVEYFQGNTHKAVHIGHVRNICLGEALCRLQERQGHKVTRVNFYGDIGPHVAKCLWGLKHLNETPPDHHKGIWLGSLYTEVNKRIKQDPTLADTIKTITKELYEGKETWVTLWKETRQWCLDDFDLFFKDFDVQFDRLYPESETGSIGKTFVEDMLKKDIAINSEGAIIIDLEPYKLGIFVLLTTEGYELYSTKDLGLAQLKLQEYPTLTKSIYVVGSEQNLHLKQVFKTLELTNYPLADKLHHLSYGLVMLPEGKMSSREGTIVLYEDLMQNIRKKTLHEVQKRHSDWNDAKITATAATIAFAALKFWMVNREPQKNVIFDWEQACDLEGETGPYIQYAVVRANSVLRQANATTGDYTYTEPSELRLLQLLHHYKGVLDEAAKKYRPHLLATYLITLAQHFNEFYHQCPILKSNARAARLALTRTVKNVLQDGLHLLAIETPEEM